MREPYFADDSLTLFHGDALAALRDLPDRSVDCCVTSPPYFGLRDYGTDPGEWPEVVFTPVAGLPPLTIPAMWASLGLEPNPWAYVGHLVLIFREVKRVLADDGTFWLNIGDSYSGGGRSTQTAPTNTRARGHAAIRPTDGIPAGKNLLGIPWRTAFALQADGWILRNDVAWAKPNAMPESVTDRLSNRYEHLFLFSRKQRYWFDLDPIREVLTYPDAADGSRVFGGKNKAAELTTGSSARRTGSVYGKAAATNLAPTGGRHLNGDGERGKNPGDVWSIPTQPFAGAHFATMPPALAERCVQAGCKPGGVVLDPFSGTGTTGLAATRHGHPFVGIDLNAGNLDLSLSTRLAQAGLPFANLADSG